MTLETRDAIGSIVPTPYGVSAFVDNLFFLRFVETRGQVQRLISILKVRSADFDPSLHALQIDASGLHIAGRYTDSGDIIPSALPVDREMSADQSSQGTVS